MMGRVRQQFPDTDPGKANFREFAELYTGEYGHPPTMWSVFGGQLICRIDKVDGLWSIIVDNFTLIFLTLCYHSLAGVKAVFSGYNLRDNYPWLS